jgi:hypothetical protein
MEHKYSYEQLIEKIVRAKIKLEQVRLTIRSISDNLSAARSYLEFAMVMDRAQREAVQKAKEELTRAMSCI